MATVWIPALLRPLTGGDDHVVVAGRTVRELIEALEQRYPGIKTRLCDDHGLRPGMAVAVDSLQARLGLAQPVADSSEVHFLPAIAGGAD